MKCIEPLGSIRKSARRNSARRQTARNVWLVACAAILALVAFARQAPGQQEVPPAPVVLVAVVEGAIGVGTRYFIEQALQSARDRDAALLVIRMDTPGGLVASMREIVKDVIASPVPVAVYVAPTGARAASAGTYIAYAAHVAAMAPGTHLGAATPVSIGLPGTPSPGGSDKKSSPSAMENKVLNDAVAGIRALAQLRGRNADWAEEAVRKAATLTASEALKNQVVDKVAANLPDLLRQIDGMRVRMSRGERVLQTLNATIVEFPQTWKARFLGAITDPNIAFILLLIGFYGIVFEFWAPGHIAPGVIGAVSLLVGMAALSMLPLNIAGLALLVLGLALMAAEGLAPGFGVLGFGGVVAFLLGGAFLFDPAGADFDLRVGLPVLVSSAVTSALMLAIVLGFIMRVRRRKPVTGDESLIGAAAEVIDWKDEYGRVRLAGEIWTAWAKNPLAPGQIVRTIARDGLCLNVEPAQKEE